ncbi:MAG: hypothetical protein JRD49_13630, partial [Deltaproteobacteria bacterium]|nr:hypothetical protein [Deltaproteobacteria bacterium]
QLAVEANTLDRWFWFVTFVLILIALFGWVPAFYAVMGISAFQVIYFSKRDGPLAFTTQMRIFYFVVTLLGLWAAIRFPLFVLLLLGTTMVTFAGRCVLALILKKMPWNKGMSAEGASGETGQGS